MSYHQRPRAGTRTGRVWEIADELSRRTGRRARRSEVIERFAAEGGNPNTANTQYQAWKKTVASEFDPEPDTGARPEPGTVDEQWLAVAPDGRLLIPAAMREAMMLDSDGAVTASVVDGELRVISPGAAIHRAQKIARKYKKPEESVVEEFLAERRALWGEE